MDTVDREKLRRERNKSLTWIFLCVMYFLLHHMYVVNSPSHWALVYRPENYRADAIYIGVSYEPGIRSTTKNKIYLVAVPGADGEDRRLKISSTGAGLYAEGAKISGYEYDGEFYDANVPPPEWPINICDGIVALWMVFCGLHAYLENRELKITDPLRLARKRKPKD